MVPALTAEQLPVRPERKAQQQPGWESDTPRATNHQQQETEAASRRGRKHQRTAAQPNQAANAGANLMNAPNAGANLVVQAGAAAPVS
eukprot:g9828.t1